MDAAKQVPLGGTNATPIITPDTTLGTLLDTGDRLAGRIRVGDALYALLLPPATIGRLPAAQWNTSRERVPGAQSYCDGFTNTAAMARAGSAIAQAAIDRGLYIPARDELECLYRTFKPGTDKSGWFRAGDNPSSVPVGYPYTAEDTLQTTIAEYRTGGAEAIPEEWIWSSTQYARLVDSAWCQLFGGGDQTNGHEGNEFAVVLVRRVLIR